MSKFQLSKDGLLSQEEIKILQALRDVSEFDANFLSNEGYSAYNQFQDRAEELNKGVLDYEDI